MFVLCVCMCGCVCVCVCDEITLSEPASAWINIYGTKYLCLLPASSIWLAVNPALFALYFFFVCRRSEMKQIEGKVYQRNVVELSSVGGGGVGGGQRATVMKSRRKGKEENANVCEGSSKKKHEVRVSITSGVGDPAGGGGRSSWPQYNCSVTIASFSFTCRSAAHTCKQKHKVNTLSPRPACTLCLGHTQHFNRGAPTWQTTI